MQHANASYPLMSCHYATGFTWEGGENDEMDPADVVVPDVLEGVRWIMDQEKLSNRSGER